MSPNLIPGRDIPDPELKEPPTQNAPLPRNLIPGRGQTATDPGEFFDPDLTFGTTGRGTGGRRSVTTTGGGGAAPGLPPVSLNLENAVLIKVNEEAGPRYYVEWTVLGVVLRHEVGDQIAFDELGAQDWEETITVSVQEFNSREGIDAGLVDERFGITESYTATVTRDLRVFGKEDLPDWQRNSVEVMTVLMESAREGFSPGRTLGLVAKTGAFQEQHPFFQQVLARHTPGASITEGLDFYIRARDQIRDSIRSFRGVEADVTDLTIGDLLGRGWDPEEIEDVLTGEAVLRQLPGMADQINNILKFQGSDLQVTDDNLIDLIVEGETDRTPFEMQTLINDAIRAQAFEHQGILLSPEFASSLGPMEEFETLDPNRFGQVASEIASNIFRFGLELSAEREGLSRDDLITAMTSGKQLAAVNQTLAKFARRRQIEAGGQGSSGFISGEGRLQIPSTSGL